MHYSFSTLANLHASDEDTVWQTFLKQNTGIELHLSFSEQHSSINNNSMQLLHTGTESSHDDDYCFLRDEKL